MARTGRRYVRLYQDETNLRCTLVIDASRSMEFGSNTGGAAGPRGSKLEYAQYLSTALSQVIVQQRDQVGLALVSEGLTEHLPPAGTQSHAMRIQGAIESMETRPESRLGAALRDLFQKSGRRGVLMVLSDFLLDDAEEAFGAVRLFRHRHWEVVILHLIHPVEERLPEGLAYRFEGLEGEGMVDCSPAEIRALYEARFAAHAASVRSLALAAGCDYRRVSTAVPYLQTLGGFLVERAG
jgi:uncharacterized protein (DUF58 family)